MPAEPEADLKVSTTNDAVGADRYREVEAAPPAAEPEIARYEPPTAIPAGLITGYDPDSLSALERTRSAIWPLVVALIVGLGIGFAGGFFVGESGAGSRETATATTAPAGKEFTEVAAPVPPVPPAPNSELKTQNSEPKNLKSEISNLKSPAPVGPGRLLIRSRPAGAS